MKFTENLIFTFNKLHQVVETLEVIKKLLVKVIKSQDYTPLGIKFRVEKHPDGKVEMS